MKPAALGFLSGLLLAATASQGGVDPVAADSAAAVLPDSSGWWQYGWEDPEETVQLLQELQEAGAMLTPQDWRRLGLAGGPAGAATAPGRSVRGVTCRWLERRGEDGQAVSTARLRLERPLVSGTLRLRAERPGSRRWEGGIRFGRDSWFLALGGTGLQHGLGLVASAPGRWSGLSATESLGGGGEGVRSWGGPAGPGTVGGIGGRLDRGPLRLETLFGGLRSDSAAWYGARARQVRVAWRRAGGELALLTGVVAGWQGDSLAWRRESRPVCWQVEAARWRPAGGLDWSRAWAVRARREERSWTLESLASAADGPAGPPLGARPAVLKGWSGDGLAVRGRYRPADGITLQGLVAGGRQQERTADGPRLDRWGRVEAAAQWMPAGGSSLLLRQRWDESRRDGWGQQPLWQGAAVCDERRDEQTIVGWRSACGVWALRADLRVLRQRRWSAGETTRPLRRQLVTLQADRPGRVWRLRFVLAEAWGDPVDLVSALAPVSGLVQPRHWGLTRREASVGIERRWAFWNLQAAVAGRTPAGSSAPPARVEWYLGASANWP